MLSVCGGNESVGEVLLLLVAEEIRFGCRLAVKESRQCNKIAKSFLFSLGQFITKLTSDCETAQDLEKFHVLALSRIDENSKECDRDRQIIRRPSIKIDNWDLIYTETSKGGFLGPVVNCCKNDQNAATTPKGSKANER